MSRKPIVTVSGGIAEVSRGDVIVFDWDIVEDAHRGGYCAEDLDPAPCIYCDLGRQGHEQITFAELETWLDSQEKS